MIGDVLEKNDVEQFRGGNKLRGRRSRGGEQGFLRAVPLFLLQGFFEFPPPAVFPIPDS